jgi:hypothetical protein
VLGVRYFACGRCETVVADVKAPIACCECGASEIEEIAGEGAASEYFVPSARRRGHGREGGRD